MFSEKNYEYSAIYGIQIPNKNVILYKFRYHIKANLTFIVSCLYFFYYKHTAYKGLNMCIRLLTIQNEGNVCINEIISKQNVRTFFFLLSVKFQGAKMYTLFLNKSHFYFTLWFIYSFASFVLGVSLKGMRLIQIPPLYSNQIICVPIYELRSDICFRLCSYIFLSLKYETSV